MAEEYEYLAHQRGHHLANNVDEIEDLKRKNERLEREMARWREFVHMAYADVIAMWIDSQIANGLPPPLTSTP